MKRKNLKTVSCLILTSVVISACGTPSVDEVSQKMINDIDALGEITEDDEEAINKLIERYATLSDSQKNGVSNYSKLLDAQDQLDTLKAEAKESLENSRKFYANIDQSVTTLKKKLGDPQGFKLEEVYYYQDTPKIGGKGWIAEIKYSTGNGSSELGEIIAGVLVSTGCNLFDTAKSISNGEDGRYSIKVGENFYSSSENISEDDIYAFKLNLDDYVEQGYSLN